MKRRKLAAEELERIAAFVDGRLDDAGERSRFLESLDRDPALYEVFVETVRSRHEPPDGGSTRSPGRETEASEE